MADDDDAVGYGRPPREFQFRPGQSGNPSGRPKRRPSFRTVLLGELAASMADKQHAHAGSKLEAFVNGLIDAAIAGDVRVQTLLANLLLKLGDAEEQQIASLTSDDQAILESYIDDEVKRRAGEADATRLLSERETE